jgi:hypothetical protein
MRGYIIRRLLVVLIIFAPVFSYTGCKKQPKCGCNGDVIFALDSQPAIIYFNDTGTSIYFYLTDDPYSQYNFCNPSEMFPKLANSKSGDVLEVSGDVFWDCTYIMQASNSSYPSLFKIYQVHGKDVSLNPYGKK